jgi:hypothetical protein
MEKIKTKRNMSGSIRTFIALELPPTVISLLHTVQQELKQLKIRARWVRAENIHSGCQGNRRFPVHQTAAGRLGRPWRGHPVVVGAAKPAGG